MVYHMLYEALPAVASGKPSVETPQIQPAVAAKLTVAPPPPKVRPKSSQTQPPVAQAAVAAQSKLAAQRCKAMPPPRRLPFLPASNSTTVRLRSLNDESYEISNLNSP